MGTNLRDRTSKLPQKFVQIKPVGRRRQAQLEDDGTQVKERFAAISTGLFRLVSQASSWWRMITAGRKRRPLLRLSRDII